MHRSKHALGVLFAGAAIVLVAILAVLSSADAQAPAQTAATPTTTPVVSAPAPKPKCAKLRQHNRVARIALRYSSAGGNYVARRSLKRYVRKAAIMRACAKEQNPRRYRAMKKAWRTQKANWRFHAYIDQITPYGKWAVPSYIVMCESGGGFSVWNRSSSSPERASGAYQIIGPTWRGHGGSRYAAYAAYAPAWAQHIIASRIWRSGGASQWECS